MAAEQLSREDSLLIKEYELCLAEMSASMTRLWQSLTALGAVAIAVALGLVQIVPDEGFDLWFRLSAGWIGWGVIAVAVLAWSLAATLETFKQHVTILRMLKIERQLPLRLATYARAFFDSTAALSDAERTELADSWRRRPKGPTPSQTCVLIVVICVLVEVLLLAAAILTTAVLTS